MTHEDAVLLLPAYVLGAFDGDVAEFEAHIDRCPRCRIELAAYMDTTASLGEAVEAVPPPASLRRAVLDLVPESPRPSPAPARRFSPISWFSAPAAAALLAALVLLLAVMAIQQQQLQAARSELALSSRGLELLTSTETIVQRLNPVADPASTAHGHWYHRPGIDTQVIVVEFLPTPPAGDSYYGWLHHADGSWQPTGAFSLDGNGYGRQIILGGDGSDVQGVTVTRQPKPTPAPSGETVLRWPAG